MSTEFEISNERLAVLIQQGYKELYERLWEQTKKFLKLQAFKYYSQYRAMFDGAGVVLEDCYQSCFLALVDAVNAYDITSGFSLLAYTKYPLTNHLKALISSSRGEKIEPLNLSLSIDAAIDNADESGNTLTFADTLIDEAAAEAFDYAEREIVSEHLSGILSEICSRLNWQEQRVITMFFYQNIGIAQISDFLGCDASRVKRHALYLLRRYIRKYKACLGDFDNRYKAVGLRAFQEQCGSSVELAAERISSFD
ncbi:MAG: sigma-70 family RNA polymerase sigma factor [Clostridia bacterium]|nr:sigma-70 family RNA polymerase sigma factor [Clostridia bacterium]